MPPLRARREDIAPLAKIFLGRLNAQYGLNKQFAGDALEALSARSYPGNVRELRNVVERMMINSTGDLMTASDIK